ncbi:MAG: methylmalonyl-CoA mutase subunit beta [Actinomycetota bacterium]|nr:methylmalonyl-CoA mutase subunit beta [Actinomycetota bacterium]
MSAPPEHLALAAEFPAATRETWRAMVTAVLARSGVAEDPEVALASRTYDGISIKPLYTADDGPPLAAVGLPGVAPFVRGRTAELGAGWDVRQRHADPDAGRTNAAVLADLTNGVISLWLVLGQGGIAITDLPAALDGVHLDLAPVVLDAGADTPAALEALLAVAAERGVARAELFGSLGADPIGLRARTGAAADMAGFDEVSERARSWPNLQVATVDGTVYHDAGGSDSDELAIAAAVGVLYLRALTDAGRTVDQALSALEFRFAVTADQFLSIAKLRAARRIWDRIAALSGAGADRRGQRQHAVTSAAMMTARDPWVNLLRTTIGCFAAAVGGAQAITVAPFDAAIGLPDELAGRIARNTQSVLHDESSLARVTDAAGGSWYVESLTDQLAQAAWRKFTAIERAGGALAALDDGTIDGLLAAAREERAEDIAHRRAPITGVSEYAFVAEEPVVRRPAPAAPSGGPLAPRRYAQEFEALRDRADAADVPPVVLLAALGPVAAHRARIGFAINLFQAGGIESLVATGELADIAAALRGSGSKVACLCSANRLYAELAAPAAEALRAAGATHVWLAGPPGEVPGVDGYLFTGVDALAVLGTTLDKLGVPR